MNYRFKIYYIARSNDVFRKFKERFRTTISVNYESFIETDEEGRRLLEEAERLGFIQIRALIQL